MSNVTRLPPFTKAVRVEADIQVSQRDEFDGAMIEIVAVERPRMDALNREVVAIKLRATAALQILERAINDHATAGQTRRSVGFLAGLYNGQDYPFDLTELRGLDTKLSNACLDHLNYDRLGIAEVHKHLANGEHDLHRWLLPSYSASASPLTDDRPVHHRFE